MEKKYGYIAILNGRRIEIYAPTLLAARQQAIAQLKPRKKDMGYLVVALAEVDGQPVIHKAVD